MIASFDVSSTHVLPLKLPRKVAIGYVAKAAMSSGIEYHPYMGAVLFEGRSFLVKMHNTLGDLFQLSAMLYR